MTNWANSDERESAIAAKWAAAEDRAEALAAEVKVLQAAMNRERQQHTDDLRCALEALDCCIEDSVELLGERAAQWGNYRKDKQATMAAMIERHQAVAERLRSVLNGA